MFGRAIGDRSGTLGKIGWIDSIASMVDYFYNDCRGVGDAKGALGFASYRTPSFSPTLPIWRLSTFAFFQSMCDYDNHNVFAEVCSVEGVDLCWARLDGRHPTYLIHTVVGRTPVMWIKLNSYCRPFPTQVVCRTFRGTIRTEWMDGRPPLLRLLLYGILEFARFPVPCHRHKVLRNGNSSGIIAFSGEFSDGTFQGSGADIVAGDNAYRIRMEHLPARRKVLYNGSRITVADGSGEVAMAVVDYTKPERGRIVVTRAVQEIEAAIAFMFLDACELERDTAG